MDVTMIVQTGTGSGEQGEQYSTAEVEIDIPYAGDCENCPTKIEYDATVDFNNLPDVVYVYHIEKSDSDWQRVGPVTIKTFDGR